MTRNYGLAGGYLTPPSKTMTCPVCGGAGKIAIKEKPDA